MDDPDWPRVKLTLRRAAGPNGRALLLTTGAMNPPHRGHVAMLHQARSRLEAAGFAVVGAFMSPSHDAYVQPKALSLGTIGLSSGFRLEVARRMVADDPLVSVGAWEARQPGRWPDFPEVCAALQAEFAGCAVFYVCGTDHARKCGLWNGMRAAGVVVVPREGEASVPEQPARRAFVAAAAEGDAAALSSTKVRRAMADADFDFVRRALSAGAAELLLRPLGDEFGRFVKDFGLLRVERPMERPAAAPRTVFISLSALLRKPWAELAVDPRLPSALFFFGSKRAWVFPASEAERAESAANNPRYLSMEPGLRAEIERKEREGLCFWLKPDGFVYDGGLHSGDPGAFQAASEWLQALRDPQTGEPYRPLRLDPAWWRGGAAGGGFDAAHAVHETSVEHIVTNLQNGAHDYGPVCECLVQSNPNLAPALQ